MKKLEKLIYKFGLWIYCKTSGRNAFVWPTKYGRPLGAWLMSSIVIRQRKRRLTHNVK